MGCDLVPIPSLCACYPMIRRHLVDAGFIGDDEATSNYNEHATNGLIVSSAMCAGLYPRIAHLHTKISKSTGKRGGVVISDNKSAEVSCLTFSDIGEWPIGCIIH